eukprot:scaffold3618_cov129-Cylindrotheca_fusiformis.AAC.7
MTSAVHAALSQKASWGVEGVSFKLKATHLNLWKSRETDGGQTSTSFNGWTLRKFVHCWCKLPRWIALVPFCPPMEVLWFVQPDCRWTSLIAMIRSNARQI